MNKSTNLNKREAHYRLIYTVCDQMYEAIYYGHIHEQPRHKNRTDS